MFVGALCRRGPPLSSDQPDATGVMGAGQFWLATGCRSHRGQACLHQSILRCFGSMRCTMPAPLRAAHSPTPNFQSFGCLGVSSGSTDGFTSRSIMRSLTYCFKRSYGTCPTFGDEGANTFIATHPKRTSESGKSNQNLASGPGKSRNLVPSQF